jgi:hypothetical protein
VGADGVRCACQKLFHWACLSTSDCALRCRTEAVRTRTERDEQRQARQAQAWGAFLISLPVAIGGSYADVRGLAIPALLTLAWALAGTCHETWLRLQLEPKPPLAMRVCHTTTALLTILVGWLALDELGLTISFGFFGLGTFLEWVRMALPVAALLAAPGLVYDRSRPYSAFVLTCLLTMIPLMPSEGQARRYTGPRECRTALSDVEMDLMGNEASARRAGPLTREQAQELVSHRIDGYRNFKSDIINHMVNFYTIVPPKGTGEATVICRDHAAYFAQRRARQGGR